MGIVDKKNHRAKVHYATKKILNISINEIDQLISNNNKSDVVYEQQFISDLSSALSKTIPNKKDELRKWVIDHNVSRRSVNSLLRILRGFGLNWLSTDSRTLCKSPRTTNIYTMVDGQYWYDGVEANIRRSFSNITSNLTLDLNVNVDGVPLMKSSSAQFWPILSNVHSELRNNNTCYTCTFHQMKIYFADFPDIEPFVIAIWCGKKKPSDVNAFLWPFVNEMLHLIQNGMTINGFEIKIKIRCLVCDTPARCFLKGKIFKTISYIKYTSDII